MQTLADLLGTQRYVVNEIADGLEKGIHFFVILKGRQQGITTILLALDLYWEFTHAGLQGTLITDTDENREMFRTTLGMYIEGLSKEWKIPVRIHTEKQLVLKNRSRFFYQVAGTRKKAGLGRGKAMTYLHGTETSSWGDEEGLASLLASLAETNPDRLYVFESTAHGPNMFEEMYKTAKAAKSQRAIFCGWWRNQFYVLEKGTPLFETYWDGELTEDEKAWVGDVKHLYDFDITPEQIAWWRWKLTESIKDDMLMYQEFPPTEDYAFILSGVTYFPVAKVRDTEKEARELEPKLYRYVFGNDWQDTEAVESNDKLCELTVWEDPIDTAYYVLGVQPAYGPSDWAHEFIIEVYRCYSDGMEQVAEFATMEINTDQFAWVIAHLAGAYKNSTLNMEMTGAGQSVANELKKLKRQAAVMGGKRGPALMNVLGSMSNYIWRRIDNMGGMSNSIGWVTSHSSHERALSYFKSSFERDLITLRSPELLNEMKKFTRGEDGLKPRGKAGDGRIIATSFACSAYSEQVHGRLIDAKISKNVSHAQESKTPNEITTQRNVSNYLKRIGLYDAHNS